ncbi:CorA family divalent cation transporter [Neomegalonema sp.]|uniref:CorA family divalent cation transporter n=1 Tax=Neomegalonema sp. TaxID=2039713 RepID=UPI0026107BB2|nr:CorA family divalent cation transporter [Neomegalonema sp.]MDD2867956.1 CorA family divalent cation transporter [Neomegalonema sp.]
MAGSPFDRLTAGDPPVIDHGLLGAWRFDAEGRARRLNWGPELNELPAPGDGWVWVHLRLQSPRARDWLTEAAAEMPESAMWALLEEDVAPRVSRFDDGVLIVLRAVNLNPGAEPEDMVSIRLFVTPTRVVSVAARRIWAVGGVISDCEGGRGPATVGDFVVRLVEDLRANAEPILDDLESDIEAFELDILAGRDPRPAQHHATFNDARQDMIMLRRHFAPQAEALRRLTHQPPPWLTDPEAIREEAVGFQRIVEDLDALRERASLVRDDMYMRLNERQNRTILLLSLVSAVFLPITFVTGLLGANVGGIPLAGSHWGFWIVCGMIVGLVGLEIWLIKRLKLL